MESHAPQSFDLIQWRCLSLSNFYSSFLQDTYRMKDTLLIHSVHRDFRHGIDLVNVESVNRHSISSNDSNSKAYHLRRYSCHPSIFWRTCIKSSHMLKLGGAEMPVLATVDGLRRCRLNIAVLLASHSLAELILWTGVSALKLLMGMPPPLEPFR